MTLWMTFRIASLSLVFPAIYVLLVAHSCAEPQGANAVRKSGQCASTSTGR